MTPVKRGTKMNTSMTSLWHCHWFEDSTEYYNRKADCSLQTLTLTRTSLRCLFVTVGDWLMPLAGFPIALVLLHSARNWCRPLAPWIGAECHRHLLDFCGVPLRSGRQPGIHLSHLTTGPVTIMSDMWKSHVGPARLGNSWRTSGWTEWMNGWTTCSWWEGKFLDVEGYLAWKFFGQVAATWFSSFFLQTY